MVHRLASLVFAKGCIEMGKTREKEGSVPADFQHCNAEEDVLKGSNKYVLNAGNPLRALTQGTVDVPLKSTITHLAINVSPNNKAARIRRH